MAKYVYFFGGGAAEGGEKLRNLVGGKGAGLADMVNLGIPVPPGFTITTEVCTVFYEREQTFPEGLEAEVAANLKKIEEIMGMKFGDPKNPLLLSIRSGARASMPGMMDTVLNLGLNEQTVKGLADLTGNERFAYDCYRRFVAMYGDVVLGLKPETQGRAGPLRGDHRCKEEAEGHQARHRVHASTTSRTWWRASRRPSRSEARRRLSRRPDGAALGRHRRGLQLLEQRPRHRLPGAEQHPRLMGHGRQRAGHGLRQHGQGLGYGRGLHPEPGHRRQRLLRRVSPQRPGRGRGGGHQHPAAHQQEAEGRCRRCQASKKRCRSRTPISSGYGASSRSTTATCRTSSSPSRQGKLWMLQTRTGKRTAFAAFKIAVDMVQGGAHHQGRGPDARRAR